MLRYPVYWAYVIIPIVLDLCLGTHYIGLMLAYPLYWTYVEVPSILGLC